MTEKTIKIQTDTDGIRHWAYILQHGVTVETGIGSCVRRVLEDEFAIAHAYVETRIQTVFLDGMPVDDIDTAVVHDGARMGLAAALPGAAGIAMRRNSPYAALRGDITRSAETETRVIQGSITLLLFNLIMEEQGPAFLQREVGTSGYRFGKMLAEHPAGPLHISCDGASIDRNAALDWAQKNPEAQIRLRVEIAQ